MGRENIKLQQIPISQITHADYCVLKPEQTINQAINTLVKAKKSEGYLKDQYGKLMGKFDLPNLLGQKNKNLKITEIQINDFLKLHHTDNILDCIEKCKDFVGESIPVIRNNSIFEGVVSEGDLFQIFLKITKEEKEMENKD